MEVVIWKYGKIKFKVDGYVIICWTDENSVGPDNGPSVEEKPNLGR